MQKQKECTKPVRIRQSVINQLEQLAIEESKKRGKLLTIAEIVDELLRAEIQQRLQF